MRGDVAWFAYRYRSAVGFCWRYAGRGAYLPDCLDGKTPRSGALSGSGWHCHRHPVWRSHFADKILADPYTQLPSITFWLLGGLSTITHDDLYSSIPVLLLGMLPLLLLRWRMNLLSLPDDEAKTMGVNVKRLRLIFIICATLITASAVSVAGIIGWIGLVVPHICRLVTGDNYQRLFPASMLGGGLLLLLTDTLARSLFTIELPLGILTALIGAPFS